jgi:hypothetical protein
MKKVLLFLMLLLKKKKKKDICEVEHPLSCAPHDE